MTKLTFGKLLNYILILIEKVDSKSIYELKLIELIRNKN